MIFRWTLSYLRIKTYRIWWSSE